MLDKMLANQYLVYHVDHVQAVPHHCQCSYHKEPNLIIVSTSSSFYHLHLINTKDIMIAWRVEAHDWQTTRVFRRATVGWGQTVRLAKRQTL